MVLVYDLSSITCPKCDLNNDEIEIIGEYVFYRKDGILQSYDFICHCCQIVFAKQVTLSIKEI